MIAGRPSCRRLKLPNHPADNDGPGSGGLGLTVNWTVTEKEFSDSVRRERAPRLNAVDPFLEYVQDSCTGLGIECWRTGPLGFCRLLLTFPTILTDRCPAARRGYRSERWQTQLDIRRGAAVPCKSRLSSMDEIPVLIAVLRRHWQIDRTTGNVPDTELQELFTDGLNLLGVTLKPALEALLGRAVVEIGEMAGARRADVAIPEAQAVSFPYRMMVRTQCRLRYDKRPTPMPRRCVIVGTVRTVNDPLPPDH